MKSGYIVSPSFGRVIRANSEKITIFIPFKENHKLYSPLHGKIVSIKKYKGKIRRKIFEADKLKKARLIITIANSDVSIYFYAEVGFPYRVDRIKIKKGKGSKVRRGQIIGKILFGSLTETYLPKGTINEELVSLGNKVIGGKTKIAKWKKK